MNIPEGYSALDLIGFTDRGDYSPNETYVKNDLVHHNNSVWKCKIDDTTGHPPTEGDYWTAWMTSASSMAGMSDVEFNALNTGDVAIFNHTTRKWENAPLVRVDGNTVIFGA